MEKKNNFSVDAFITFFKGLNLTDEQRKEVISRWKKIFDESKGNKIIIDYKVPNNDETSSEDSTSETQA